MSAFEEFRQTQREIAAKCDLLESLWADAAQVTEIERVSGTKIQHDDLVGQLLDEVRSRIETSVIEVGIFGNIKRGKSTLLNALVGADVSSTDVLPETAVPTWIQNGPPRSLVMYANSTVEEVTIDEAKMMSTQKFLPTNPGRKPIRVEHSMRINWLPDGVRLIDTPGLDDPALSADYEALTLAELDRVAAVIYVLASPPGPAFEELETLRSLSRRAVDKVFIVCNFHPQHWTDRQVVSDMIHNIEATIRQAAGDAVDDEDIHVYAVAALEGMRAALLGDVTRLGETGVSQLRDDLESYLLHGAFERISGFAERRLVQIVNVITDTLTQRRKVLANPSVALALKQKLELNVQSSKSLLSEIQGITNNVSGQITNEITRVFSHPYDTLRPEIQAAERTSDVEDVLRRLRVQLETAASRAATIFGQRAGLEQLRMQRTLYESFGIEERLELQGLNPSFDDVKGDTPGMPVVGTDTDLVLVGGLIGAATLGTVGATIAAGAGFAALAFLGPVGWLAGLGLGLVFGGSGGALAARVMSKGRIDTDSRDKLIREWNSTQAGVREKCKQAVSEWANSVQVELEATRSRYYHSQERELKNLVQIVSDSSGRVLELERIDELMERLNGAKL